MMNSFKMKSAARYSTCTRKGPYYKGKRGFLAEAASMTRKILFACVNAVKFYGSPPMSPGDEDGSRYFKSWLAMTSF
jgi:hypothetical protein